MEEFRDAKGNYCSNVPVDDVLVVRTTLFKDPGDPNLHTFTPKPYLLQIRARHPLLHPRRAFGYRASWHELHRS